MKIGNSFSRLFAIIETEKPCMIAGIPLINENQSIADHGSQNPESRTQNSEPRTQI